MKRKSITTYATLVLASLLFCLMPLTGCTNTHYDEPLGNEETEEPSDPDEPDEPAQIEVAGHTAVNLGLSVYWATCNVGATIPEEPGEYYAWGETTTKSSYTSSNSVTYGRSDIGNIGGDSNYDAARKNWGDSWRLPTNAECQELIEQCTWQWITQNRRKGCKVTGPNGNSIFLPAAGYFSSSSTINYDFYGYYWSSTPTTNDNYYSAYIICGSRISNSNQYYGQSIRPVIAK